MNLAINAAKLPQRKETEMGKTIRERGWYAALLAAPLLLLVWIQLIDLGSLGGVLAWMAASLGAAALTYGLLLAAQCLLAALTGRLWMAYVILAVPTVTLAVANCLKTRINGAPVEVSDLAMAFHLDKLAGFVAPNVKLGAAAWTAVVLAAAVAAGLVVLEWRRARPPRATRLTALGVSVLALTLGLLLPRGLLTAKGEQAERNRQFGLLAGLYSGALSRQIQRPADYSQERTGRLWAELAMSETLETPEVRPHVVMVMSESFYDLEQSLPEVRFATDPTPNYHALIKEWPSGPFLSNTYGGGTGNVELEVISGIPKALHKDNFVAMEDPLEYDRLPSIVKAFGEAGYQTGYIHNYTSVIYDREVYLPRVGFDWARFEADFPADSPRSGTYLSDMALTQEIIRAFEEKKDEGPLFLFGASMENHQPYHRDKFFQPSGLEPTCETLGREELEVLDALAQGLRGADEALGALLDYFKDCGEPVLVVFWGDHLPSLPCGDGDSIYVRLGLVPNNDTLTWSPEELKRMHTTTYLIWNNYGGELEVPQTISATALGSRVLEWAGVEKPLYFRWVDRALETMLLYRSKLYVSADGRAYHAPPEQDQETMALFEELVYDILYGEERGQGAASTQPG